MLLLLRFPSPSSSIRFRDVSEASEASGKRLGHQSRSQRPRSFCTATGITNLPLPHPLHKSNGGSRDEFARTLNKNRMRMRSLLFELQDVVDVVNSRKWIFAGSTFAYHLSKVTRMLFIVFLRKFIVETKCVPKEASK